MATCKDCIHHGVCGGFTPTDLDHDVFDYCREGRTDEILDIEQRCNHFADKSRFVELSCKIGDTAWYLNPIDEICEALVERVELNLYTNPQTWIYLKYYSKLLGVYTYKSRIDMALNKVVFLTREEAEAALAERMKENGRS